MVKNNATGQEKHILYIGGTPYKSNIVYLKDFTQSSGSYRFLHKDYIGSILAISDETGNKLEQRHFDAWGNFTHLQIGNGVIMTDRAAILNAAKNLMIDRGYTSHEHFMEVGIIHMNGRLYDPLLRRFLNADENIQEPYNTQNYNKYGYVLNNPLLYNDPSGELAFLAAVGIAALIGALTYSAGVLISGDYWNFGDFLKATVFGAISGAVTFGIGSIFTPAMEVAKAATGMTGFLMEAGVSIAQAGVHGYVQGILSLAQGGTFEQAFIAGALGSLGASAFKMTAGSYSESAVGTVLFGVASGGIGSSLSGGNFWEGVVIGGMVAGLNHVAHLGDTEPAASDSGNGDCPTCPKNAKNGDVYTENSFSILDKDTWSNFGKTKTYTYFGGEWSEMKLITGDVPIGPAGSFNILKSFKSALSLFKGGALTNAGRAVTKHPQYFGFESTEALMKVFRSPSAINKLGASTIKNILRNGVKTTGSGGRYPEGWVTYTLPNGNAASWTTNGIFIGFRGLK